MLVVAALGNSSGHTSGKRLMIKIRGRWRIQERRLERSALKTLGSQMKGYLSQLCINPLRLRHPGILKEEQLYEGSGLQYSGMKKGQPYLSRKI